MRYCEIAGAHRKLTARIEGLHSRVAAGEACNVDYYLLLGVRRGCTCSELSLHVQEHMLVTLAVNVIACSPDEHCQGPRWGHCMSQVFSVQIMSTWMTTSASNPPRVYFGPG